MSRENDIDALIEHLTVAMDHARRLKAADLIFLLSMAAIATLDLPCDKPDEPPPSRGVH
jgi:hypothetical protein